MTSKTLAHWMLNIMTAAGIDTSTYKSHSSRAAGAAEMNARGMSVFQIVEKGHWSHRASTFQKFYARHIDDSNEFVLFPGRKN